MSENKTEREKNSYSIIWQVVTFLFEQRAKADWSGSSAESTNRTVHSFKDTDENIPEFSRNVSPSKQKASQAT